MLYPLAQLKLECIVPLWIDSKQPKAVKLPFQITLLLVKSTEIIETIILHHIGEAPGRHHFLVFAWVMSLA